MAIEVESTTTGVRFAVLVAPRASREAVLGEHDGALKIALTAPPVDGAANDALVAYLAKRLSVPKRSVQLIGGASTRRKRIEVVGIDAAMVLALLR